MNQGGFFCGVILEGNFLVIFGGHFGVLFGVIFGVILGGEVLCCQGLV